MFLLSDFLSLLTGHLKNNNNKTKPIPKLSINFNSRVPVISLIHLVFLLSTFIYIQAAGPQFSATCPVFNIIITTTSSLYCFC